MDTQTVTIDVDQMFQNLAVGVNRAVLFMGFGLNAALDPAFRRYQLRGIAWIDFIPQDVPEAELATFKGQYGEWVVLAGCRDLIESFETFLDVVDDVCVGVNIVHARIDPAAGQKRHKRFTRLGLEDKLATLAKDFSISTPKGDALVSISKARNAIVHRRSVVGHEDGPAGVSVKWWGFDLQTVTPSGEITMLSHGIPPEGITLTGGAQIQLKSSLREKSFSLGESIAFSPRDATEICLVVLEAGKEVIATFVQHLKAAGVREAEAKAPPGQVDQEPPAE